VNFAEGVPPPEVVGLPPEGTVCRFTFGGRPFEGRITGSSLVVDGFDDVFNSFSAASKRITQTSRNGWFDWYFA
jgi:hypothetical protein